jgi:hypothetical protein
VGFTHAYTISPLQGFLGNLSPDRKKGKRIADFSDSWRGEILAIYFR